MKVFMTTPKKKPNSKNIVAIDDKARAGCLSVILCKSQKS